MALTDSKLTAVAITSPYQRRFILAGVASAVKLSAYNYIHIVNAQGWRFTLTQPLPEGEETSFDTACRGGLVSSVRSVKLPGEV